MVTTDTLVTLISGQFTSPTSIGTLQLKHTRLNSDLPRTLHVWPNVQSYWGEPTLGSQLGIFSVVCM